MPTYDEVFDALRNFIGREVDVTVRKKLTVYYATILVLEGPDFRISLRHGQKMARSLIKLQNVQSAHKGKLLYTNPQGHKVIMKPHQ